MGLFISLSKAQKALLKKRQKEWGLEDEEECCEPLPFIYDMETAIAILKTQKLCIHEPGMVKVGNFDTSSWMRGAPMSPQSFQRSS